MKQCDMLINYFNKHLSKEESSEFEEHMKNCGECQRDIQDLEQLTGDIAFLSANHRPPQGMKKRILNNVFAEDEKRAARPAIANKYSQRSWFSSVLAASLILSLMGNGYALWKYGENEKGTELANEPVSVLKTRELQANNKLAAAGTVSMVKKEGKTNIVIQTKGLEPVENSQVYQVWLLKNNKPYPAGAFVTDQNGNGTVVYTMNQKEIKQQWDTIAITLEPNPNNVLPKGEIVLSSSL